MDYNPVDWRNSYGELGERKAVDMLISSDLMRHLAVYVEPPAQLCLIRVLGSDHEYVFRVRYGDVHLDYPFSVPIFDTQNEVEKYCNWDEIRKSLAVMSAMVVPPGTAQYNPYDSDGSDMARGYRPSPQVLAPMSSEHFHYWT